MHNPKTTLLGYLGLMSALATFLGALGTACGGGTICGWFTMGALIINQVVNAAGNIVSQDGGH